MQKTSPLSIDWTSQKVLSQIAEQINKPLAEIIRLTQYIQNKAKKEGVDYETERLSSILLESSEQIEALIESIVEIEANKRIEILIHDKFKYPNLYKFKNTHKKPKNNIPNLNIEPKTLISKADLEWLMELERTIIENIDSYFLSITWLAKKCATSERQIFRKIEKYTGLTPSKYIRSIRLHKAKELLESYTFSTINEVASAVGLKDPYYFSGIYREEFGVQPRKYFL